MAAPWSEKFYKSAAWRKNSRAYLASVDGLCERCMARGIYTPALIVHHRIHLTPENMNNPSITMGWFNLEALCLDCHNKEHFQKQEKRYAFGADGELLTE